MKSVNKVASELVQKMIAKKLEATTDITSVVVEQDKISFRKGDVGVVMDFTKPNDIQITALLPVMMANGETHTIEYWVQNAVIDAVPFTPAVVEKRLTDIAKAMTTDALAMTGRYKKIDIDEYMNVKKLDDSRKALKALRENGWVPQQHGFVLSPNSAPNRTFILEKDNRSILLSLNADGYELTYPTVNKGGLKVETILSMNHHTLDERVRGIDTAVSGRFFSFTGDGLSLDYKQPAIPIISVGYESLLNGVNVELEKLGYRYGEKLSNDEASVKISLGCKEITVKNDRIHYDMDFLIIVDSRRDDREYMTRTAFSRSMVEIDSDINTFLLDCESLLDKLHLTRTSPQQMLKNSDSGHFDQKLKLLKRLFGEMDTTLIAPTFVAGEDNVFTKDGQGYIHSHQRQQFIFEDIHPELDERVLVKLVSPVGYSYIDEYNCYICDGSFECTSLYEFEDHLNEQALLKTMSQIASKM